MKNGMKTGGGCAKGIKCRFYHPRMCKSSVYNRICHKDDCRFHHINGTRFSKSPDYYNEGIRECREDQNPHINGNENAVKPIRSQSAVKPRVTKLKHPLHGNKPTVNGAEGSWDVRK